MCLNKCNYLRNSLVTLPTTCYDTLRCDYNEVPRKNISIIVYLTQWFSLDNRLHQHKEYITRSYAWNYQKIFELNTKCSWLWFKELPVFLMLLMLSWTRHCTWKIHGRARYQTRRLKLKTFSSVMSKDEQVLYKENYKFLKWTSLSKKFIKT